MNDAARHGITDPLGFLAGSWTAQRRLLDRAAGVAGTFAGTTTFTPDHEEGLQWAEQGTVRWPSFEGPASRSYRVLRTTGAAIEVRFEDGRVLCCLDLTTGGARDEHACDPDTYRVDFAVRSSDRIEYCWDVTGPAKDFLLTTTLTRVRTRAKVGPHSL
ncbi:hypothetical protein FJV46_02810 [Arthrobacter agilis]|uniref:DUF6314 family protein n=1 Tax=Arthrobacter agilis TaxID=37921 RepID=UPI000CE3417B|nr:DUF6314 family protein [Arthrobacter agilis]PPB47199.1 hypothetical protein CI784_02500 [Arthrobacter agilis]TPV26790.1 hypothetical protein FJV46_02810 [Arthrobacter agilis]VDR33101.1 Uncharacterised protein [Arthrobacter agilis]